ncbi:MAG: hypothetical protein AAF571_01375 [Verrucomicrobiota bacterium]
MQRVVFTWISVVILAGMLPATLCSEEDLPVVDVSTESDAVAEDVAEEATEAVETSEEMVEEAVSEAEAEAEVEIERVFNEADSEASSTDKTEEVAEENVGKAETADVKEYVLQGDWDLDAKTDDQVVIRKIYEFLNDPKVTKFGKEKSIEYEFKYFNHGAITKAQRYNREGQYYVVTWTNKGEPADYQLRIDYRQSKTRDKINTITIPYPNAKGTFKGTFSVTGDHYYMYGSILSWRISVVRDGVIVAQNKSFVW